MSPKLALPTIPPGPTSVAQTLPQSKVSLSSITSEGDGLPPRWVICGQPGFGKTTMATFWPYPVFMQTENETGLDVLINVGLVKPTPHTAPLKTWSDIMAFIHELKTVDHDYKTLVIDTLNGIANMRRTEITRTHFKGSDKDFSAWASGPEVLSQDWRLLLSALDGLRQSKKMQIVCLVHDTVINQKNPEEENFQVHAMDLHKYCTQLTIKWAHVVLYGHFYTVLDDKGKAQGGTNRRFHAQNGPTWQAKNLLGLPPMIELGDTPEQAYEDLQAAIAAGSKKPKDGGKGK